MVKIKRKVQKNLPQLIEWLLESGKSECIVISSMNNIVQLEPYGVIRFSQKRFYSEEIFIVEVEEEITEDTKLPKSLTIFEHNGNTHIEQHDSKCINDILCLDKKVKGSSTNTIHMVNDDGTHTLIWRDGELVE